MANDRAATVNFTDAGMFTRETDWGRLGWVGIAGAETLITAEEPCDDRDNGFERYYPVKASDGRFERIYRRYRALAARDGRVSFIGRCGTYQRLDMDQVANRSLGR